MNCEVSGVLPKKQRMLVDLTTAANDGEGEKRTGQIHLCTWEEFIGFFGGLDTNEDSLNIKIGDKTIKIQLEHLKPSDISEKLKKIRIGEKIGILRCDNPIDPIKIRKV